jgi:hypothetical protein
MLTGRTLHFTLALSAPDANKCSLWTGYVIPIHVLVTHPRSPCLHTIQGVQDKKLPAAAPGRFPWSHDRHHERSEHGVSLLAQAA